MDVVNIFENTDAWWLEVMGKPVLNII